MKSETELILRPLMMREVANMDEYLAAMQHSGSIFFRKKIPRSAIPTLETDQDTHLGLPARFVRENGDKIQEWVILRTQTSCGRYSRPWVVRLSVTLKSVEVAKVRLAEGWKEFAAGNRLKAGDFIIFLLKDSAGSEFGVHVFRGPGGSPYYLDLSDNSSEGDEEADEEDWVSDSIKEESHPVVSENQEIQSLVLSSVHHEDAPNKALTWNGEVNEAAPPLQPTIQLENGNAFPGFCKRLTTCCVQQSEHPKFVESGQFEFPRKFVRAHGVRVQDCVRLQGVHEDSPVYVIACGRCISRRSLLRLYFNRRHWGRFVVGNRLKAFEFKSFPYYGRFAIRPASHVPLFTKRCRKRIENCTRKVPLEGSHFLINSLEQTDSLFESFLEQLTSERISNKLGI